MKRIIYMTLALMLSASCEKTFDLSRIDSEKAIWLSLMPDNLGGPMEVHGHSLCTIKEVYGNTGTTEGAQVDVYVNGKLVESYSPDTDGHSFSHPLQSGDKVEAKARLDGFKDAEASTVIPEAINFSTVAASLREDGNMDVRVSYVPKEKGRYGIALMSIGSYGEMSSVEPSAMSGFQTPENMSRTTMCNGRHVTLWDRYETEVREDGTEAFTATWPYSRGRRYKVLLYSLSEELYLHLRSTARNSVSDFTESGFSSPMNCWTNIRHGLGVVGGAHITEFALDNIETE